MAVVRDLGPATAYGYAVEQGYMGTEEQFAALMADYATVGQQAAQSAQNASNSANASATSKDNAEAWAVGTINGTDVGSGDARYHNNSKYYSQQASQSATNAGTSETNAGTSETNAGNSATAAATSEDNAEAWAVGQINGVDVGSGDARYHNNSKYYSEQAAASAQAAAASAASLTVDSALSDSSTNPVQNKVVKGAVDQLNNHMTLHDTDDDVDYSAMHSVVDGHLVTTYTEV